MSGEQPFRPHETGYEYLGWEDFHMLTGLPRAAFDEWLELDAESRRDAVGIFQEPDEIEAVRDAAQGGDA